MSAGNAATGGLRAAATAAGLLDLDILPLARTDLPPAEAIADLKRRHGSFFRGGSASAGGARRVQDMALDERRAAFKAIGVRLPR